MNRTSRATIMISQLEKKIKVSQTFLKKAEVYGTEEYRMLHQAMQENPSYEVSIKKTRKKTYSKLTYEKMAAYIKLVEVKNLVEALEAFEKVKACAKTKDSAYPYVKRWFLKQYPKYSENTGEDFTNI